MAHKCEVCGNDVKEADGYRVFAGAKVETRTVDGVRTAVVTKEPTEVWFDTEHCLAQEYPDRAPAADLINVEDQPPMVLVPAEPGFQGRVVTKELLGAMMAQGHSSTESK